MVKSGLNKNIVRNQDPSLQSPPKKRLRVSCSPLFHDYSRPLMSSTPRKKETRSNFWRGSGRHAALTSRLVTAFSRSHYETAYRIILSSGPVASNAFNRVLHKIVSREIQSYVRSHEVVEDQFPKLNSLNDIEQFSWNHLTGHLQTFMPTLYTAIDGAMPRRRATTESERSALLLY
jgi:hypothetical protein